MGRSLGTMYDNFLPNVTKCMTWEDVKASHAAGDNLVVIKLDEIYGMITILMVGLGGSVIIMMVEHLVQKIRPKKTPQTIGRYVVQLLDLYVTYQLYHQCTISNPV